jgi:hypothetical protein
MKRLYLDMTRDERDGSFPLASNFSGEENGG